MSLFKIKTTKDYSKPTCAKNVHRGEKKPRKTKIKKRSEDNIIKDVRNLFRLKKEAIKDRIIRGIKNLFQQDYYKLVFWGKKI